MKKMAISAACVMANAYSTTTVAKLVSAMVHPETTPVGDPCGPDSEMFTTLVHHTTPNTVNFATLTVDCGRFGRLAIPFYGIQKVAEGKFEKLENPNVDHGSRKQSA